MDNFFVLLKIVGVFGPMASFIMMTYKIITKNGILNQNTFAWLILGSLVTDIAYIEQLLFANLMEMPFYTSGILFGMIVSTAIFIWLIYAMLRHNFSSGLHLSSLRGLI